MRAVVTGAIVVAMGLGGCATLSKGTTDRIYVVTDPPGAKATTSSGPTCVTPCNFDVNRGDKLTVAVEKPGYDPQQVEVNVQSTAAAAATSPDVTADYLGRVIDAQDGANMVHVPNPVRFKLDKTVVDPGG